ncbi:MAG TPA: hypothetical protein VLV86_21760 [Vicinamibacterales bacterium]|nr:hypothetical protein [Vicinamibacterales bacterium]
MRAFVAAFDAKDADKAVSDFEDDVQFRMEVALNRNIETGRENARQQLHRLFDRESRTAQSDTGPRVQGGNIELIQTEVIGDSKEVLVITRRIDNVTINGRPLHLPVGSSFRECADRQDRGVAGRSTGGVRSQSRAARCEVTKAG